MQSPNVLAMAAVLTAVILFGSCATKVPSSQASPTNEATERHRFRPNIDQELALRIMAGWPQAHQRYEQSRRKCEDIPANNSDAQSARCDAEPDCEVDVDFGADGQGGPNVCLTTNPHSQEWSQERERRQCLASRKGVWEVYELHKDGSVYGGCKTED